MNLHSFMQNGIDGIMGTAGRFYLKNTKGRAFLLHMLPQIRKSAALREKHEKAGRHIPPFLIASIASQCNLHCAGCYARAGGSCADSVASDMTGPQWSQVFEDAASLGTSFILLAGGEPLMRQDVMTAAANCSRVVFPVFTNGTMLDDEYLSLFDDHRHLIPVLSIEGTDTETDARRGAGVSASIQHAMDRLHEKNILFGASITVTSANLSGVLEPSFSENLRAKGCGIIFFIEYVPAEKGTESLALSADDITMLQAGTAALKQRLSDTVVLSFPGDEEAMGGCLASGRGFFHINPKGGAEPCPFSPYAMHNLKETSILDIIDSGYFRGLRELATAAGTHTGGCVLFEREHQVQALLAQEA